MTDIIYYSENAATAHWMVLSPEEYPDVRQYVPKDTADRAQAELRDALDSAMEDNRRLRERLARREEEGYACRKRVMEQQDRLTECGRVMKEAVAFLVPMLRAGRRLPQPLDISCVTALYETARKLC